MSRRRKKTVPRLSLDDKLSIIKGVIVENKDYLFVSKQFRVSISYVSKLVQNMRKNVNFLSEERSRKYKKITKMLMIEHEIKEMLHTD